MNLIQNIDNYILQYIQNNMRTPIMDIIMPVITSIGNRFTIWMLVGLILVITKKYRRYGLMIILSLILCFIIGNLSLKPLIGRIRPFDVAPLLDALLIKPPTDFSFPSGHAMSSFASAVILFYMDKKVGSLALILSTLIGFSRLYLYVHYPSDVFCGMLIGILLGNIAIILFNNIEKISLKTTYKS